jgi:hypothetical protein
MLQLSAVAMRSFVNSDWYRVTHRQPRRLKRPLPVFQFCGYTGLLLAFVQSLLLVRHFHLSRLILLGMTGVVVLTFFGLVMATRVITGEEQIIYYHHEIAVMVMIALFLRFTHQPLLPYLDIAILGIGLFLACGRVGCQMVGCCHGRPCGWGFRYREEHAAATFPDYLVGVRLFPIQVVESIFVLFVVAFGIVLALWGYPPGTALVLYVVAYGIGRFWLEFARGDVARPYLWGFSQAQWISLLLAIAVVASEWKRILPVARWHWAAAMALVVSMVLIGLWRRFDSSRRFELLHPRHVREIIGALDHLELSSWQAKPYSEPSGYADEILVARTSLGYRISAGRSVIGSRTLNHYSVSKDNGSLSLRAAQVLSHLIARVEESPYSFKLIRGDKGVFHILFESVAAPNTKKNPPPRRRLSKAYAANIK